VLQLVAEGRANKQIASLLGIAVRTVEAHRASIMRKLNLTDHASLVRYAVRKGIVPMDEQPTARQAPAPPGAPNQRPQRARRIASRSDEMTPSTCPPSLWASAALSAP
jgi:hypothetical protein